MKKQTTKKLFTFILLAGLLLLQSAMAQVVRDHRKGQKTTVKPETTPATIGPEATFLATPQVMLYEHANYDAQFKVLGVGLHLLTDFNDVATSIKIPNGLVAVIYEAANEAGGYGNYVDLLEDCPDLSIYNFNDITSYVNVFSATRPGYVYVRGRNTNNQIVPGHWEREKANGAKPDNSLPALVLLLPVTNPTNSTVLSVNGPATTISTLGVQTTEGLTLWERAMNDQMGIIGNDYRGIEKIGTAAFEREFTGNNGAKVADALGFSSINFWFPQKRSDPRDHRSLYKRTLHGIVTSSAQEEIADWLPDYDVHVNIKPSPKFEYLINDAVPANLSRLTENGQKIKGEKVGCPTEFTTLEAEIATDFWPKGNHLYGRSIFADMCLKRVGSEMCVYGPWIYDAGHCDQPEIHPAEQFWWNENVSAGKKYSFNVFCDASERFWWRDQMDDGSKLKPWGAPPIKGLFAIAFEKSLGEETAINETVTKFEVSYIDHYNLAEYPDADQVYNLVYQNKTLVSFIPHNNAFKVSYENVGLKPGTSNVIRGFIVMETSVGTCTQVKTEIHTTVSGPNGTQLPETLNFPEGVNPNEVDQKYERQLFKKTKGYYIFSVLQSTISSRPPANGGLITE